MQYELFLSLEQIAAGGKVRIRVFRPRPCPACIGTGIRGGSLPVLCHECDGRGRTVDWLHTHGTRLRSISRCSACAGSGTMVEQHCIRCEGKGVISGIETRRVLVPPGADEGMLLQPVALDAEAGIATAEEEDLQVVVRTRRDARFQRRGADLWRDETVPVSDLALGLTLPLPSLEGTATLSIPAGTQPDTVFRLRGLGLPICNGVGFGDLCVSVHARAPFPLSARKVGRSESCPSGS